jgi:hypothetical protein
MNKDAFCCSEWTCTKKHILAIIGHHEKNDKHEYSMWFEIPNIVLSISQFELTLFLMFHVIFFYHNNFSGTMNMFTWDK